MMDYSLKPLSKQCCVTGQLLTPGSLCYSVLIEKNGRYERVDYSPEAWAGVPEGSLGVWRTRVPEPEVKAHPLQDLNQLFDIFASLVENANEPQKKMRYVLALWLVRKKRLIHDDTRETADGKLLVLNGTQGEGPFEILEEELTEFEMARLQAEIQSLGQISSNQAMAA